MLFHNPVLLARRFATLDVLSEGRAIAGLGIGWSKDEYQVSGIPFKDRGRKSRLSSLNDRSIAINMLLL